ncbi:helix-turn-helix domain-containing protein [Polymorphospora rubra]|uniref:helix-turn-helix domain-containing protein n=1 Tax=Polymorphospora rubra TaxID=338584 RepID=UPI0033D63A28
MGRTEQSGTLLAHLIREQRDQTLDELAASVGLSARHLSRLAQNGTNVRPHPRTRRALQNKFGHSLEQLLQPRHTQSDFPSLWQTETAQDEKPSRQLPPSTAHAGPRLGNTLHNVGKANLWTDPWNQQPSDTPNSTGHVRRIEQYPIQRRTVIRALAAIGANLATRPAAEDPLSPARSMEDWQEIVWEYGYSYFISPRSELLDDLAADFIAINDEIARKRFGTTAQRRLAEPAALLAALIAKTCTELGYNREARHSWRTARHLSDISENPDTQLWVRGNECMGGIYQGRPVPVIIEMIDKGLQIRGNAPSGGRVSLLGVKAQIFSLAGRHSEAASALRETEYAFARLPDTVTESSDSVFGWPEQMLRHGESFVHTQAGSASEAQAAQERALALYPREQVVSRCQIQLHRSACLIRSGYIAEGLAYGSEALQGIPMEQRKRLVLTVASKVLDAVPDNVRTSRRASEFRDLVIASATHNAIEVTLV